MSFCQCVTVNSALVTLHCLLCIAYSTLFTLHCLLSTVYSTLFLCTVYSALFNLHSLLCTLTLHSALFTLHSLLWSVTAETSSLQFRTSFMMERGKIHIWGPSHRLYECIKVQHLIKNYTENRVLWKYADNLCAVGNRFNPHKLTWSTLLPTFGQFSCFSYEKIGHKETGKLNWSQGNWQVRLWCILEEWGGAGQWQSAGATKSVCQ